MGAPETNHQFALEGPKKKAKSVRRKKKDYLSGSIRTTVNMWKSKCYAALAAIFAASLLISAASAFPDVSSVEDALNGIASAVDGAINASIGRSLSSPSEHFDDPYLESARDHCLSSGAADSFFSCAKFRALRFVHRFASPSEGSAASKIVLSDVVHLVRTPEKSKQKIFPESSTVDDPRAEASELDRASRFGLRELERFARSHAVALRLGEGEDRARLIDEDAPEMGDLLEGQEETRVRKKKFALLIPFLMMVKFIKLKALLIPILIGVLIIKKILILFAIFLPTILGFLKFCKPQPPHHGYEYSSNPGAVEYGSTGYGYGGGASYAKENTYSRRNSGGFDSQSLAYRGYQQS